MLIRSFIVLPFLPFSSFLLLPCSLSVLLFTCIVAFLDISFSPSFSSAILSLLFSLFPVYFLVLFSYVFFMLLTVIFFTSSSSSFSFIISYVLLFPLLIFFPNVYIILSMNISFGKSSHSSSLQRFLPLLLLFHFIFSPFSSPFFLFFFFLSLLALNCLSLPLLLPFLYLLLIFSP